MATSERLCEQCNQLIEESWNFCPICGCSSRSPQKNSGNPLENKVKALTDMVSSLHDTALDIMGRLDYKDLLKAIVVRATKLAGLVDGYIYIVDEQENSMRLEIGIGRYEKNKGFKVRGRQGFCWHVWERAQPVVIEDYSQWIGKLDEFNDLRAVIGIPLKAGDKVTGVITISTLDPARIFSNDEVEVLSSFAPLASIALENAKMFTAIKEEIAERKKTETAILEAKAAIARSEKLASLGTMAAGIAHQISQPLNAVKISATGILYWHKQRKHRPIEEIMAEVEEISSMTSRIDKIIERIRALARSSENQIFGTCDLNRTVEQALDFIGSQLTAHGIEVLWQPEENLPPVWGSNTYIEEAVINLLTNAMQALDLVEHDRRITIRTGYHDQVTLEISDNGPGICPEIKEKIFEPFFSTKESQENMGFGLSIVNSIVNSCGGKIEVLNTEKSGTTFRLEVPCSVSETVVKLGCRQ